MLDLHTHTTASDGTMTPTELVRHAEEVGLRALAITDHDTCNGVAEALQVESEVEVVPGIEFSVVSPVAGSTAHILGLFVNHTQPLLVEAIARAQAMRADRNQRLVDNLTKMGMPVSIEEAEAETNGVVLGQVHIADVLTRKGFVKNNQEAFSKYLGTNGRAAVPKERLQPRECFAAIRGAGGVPVLAHPDTLRFKNAELRAYVEELVANGLQGIEVFYTGYQQNLCDKYTRLAREFDLVRTGGSDFHGTKKPDIKLGKGMGSLFVHDSLLEPIRERSGSH